MKIAVYTCMKNEADQVTEWLDNCADADYMVIVDTGSIDGTPQIALEHYADKQWSGGSARLRLHDACIIPWRFDVGLNTAMALIPADADVCINLAADERLPEGWRALVEASAAGTGPGPTKYWYEYEFAPTLTFNHDRMHSRRGYTWRYPFHEGLCCDPTQVESHATIRGLKIKQKQNLAVNRMERDLTLAKIAAKEYPFDARMIFYVGRQFMYAGHYREALSYLERYASAAKRSNYEHPMEQAWCAEAIAQCWKSIQGGGK